MASRTAILSVRVVSDTKEAQRGAAETASAWEKFEKRLDKASVYAAGAGGALLALGKKSVDAASRLEQSSGSVEAVFKKDASTIEAFAKSTAGSIGLAQSETQEMATILGAQLKNLGMPIDEVAGKTIDLVKLGGDLAAQYGGPTSDAVAALSSLLRGERDPIERYGVGIKQADIEAEKMALGLQGLTGEAEKQANIQATLSLLTKQTADAQGAAAREFDSVESATQRARAAWEETAAKLGEALLPTVAELMEHLSGAAGWIAENDQLVLKLATAVGGASAAILGLNAGIKAFKIGATVFQGVSTAGAAAYSVVGRFAGGMRNAAVAQSAFSGAAGTLGGKVAQLATSLGQGAAAAARWAVQTTVLTAKFIAQKTAQLAVAAASRVASAAQAIWNAVMNANPMMLIITLVVGAIALLIMNWDKVKVVATAVWDAITVAAMWLWDNALKPIGDWIVSTFGPHWEALKLVATVVWDAISAAAMWLWDTVLKPVGEWIGANMVAYWETLKLVATAVWDGISAAGRWLWDNVLKPVGQWIASNLVRNWEIMKIAAQLAWQMIQNGAQQVWSFIQSVGSWIGSTFSAAWDGMRAAGVNAFNAIIGPVQSLIGWLQNAWDWVSKLFSKGGKLIGKAFGFSAAVEVGAPVTAALGSAPNLPGLLAVPSAGASVTNVFNIEVPNYVGDRAEFIEWLRRELARATGRAEGIIRA